MLSIQARQALAKLVLPLLFVLAFAFILVGQVRHALVDKARMDIADALAPAYGLMAAPGEHAGTLWREFRGFLHLDAENARLRDENAKLRRWYDVAVALANENAQLKANLHWIPDNAPSFVTGHALRDAGGVYSRAILLAVGDGNAVHVGDVAMDAAALIGRVSEVGAHTVRILLINDDASRIPVTLAASHGTAIMAGDGTSTPRLLYYAQENHPVEGERVLTSEQTPPGAPGDTALAGLPGGLPIGTVHYVRPGAPVVVPDGGLSHPDIVRVFDYGRPAQDAPDAPGRVKRMPLPTNPGLPSFMLPLSKPGQG
ncbi:rod shape-determining protein MreC [Neoasaia chiangmaiensis NBRC 101099]|uniref:Rod shape-determining protein MreC n=1 Tax=Neoasaia chiangmaiensis TaxID=320497 RepID=A0A1U9KSR2_9PROT|nr:rod shape-determining protein MreC [Neoasaia chiangmaiensis]AQS88802.1 rod shape-determining protein MreC [Neoasaia chiangmaiensis]GBR40731.1 rod shape-determining protein MreC [Neoasaia chiangmaiensis NBRC 101099]GEN13765.1 hypothetical protein NCH01_01960 [Neoasaia chiangmaiensis]